MRVAVALRGLAVGGPARVSHGGVAQERLVHVKVEHAVNLLAQRSNLADLAKDEELVGFVAVDSDAYRLGCWVQRTRFSRRGSSMR